jgi:hypothetical protein
LRTFLIRPRDTGVLLLSAYSSSLLISNNNLDLLPQSTGKSSGSISVISSLTSEINHGSATAAWRAFDPFIVSQGDFQDLDVTMTFGGLPDVKH